MSFHSKKRPLPGILAVQTRVVFVEQLMESIRRVRYVAVMKSRDISVARAEGDSDMFDPLKAAVMRGRSGHLDDAFWLVFLSVHFGKNKRTGWALARAVYGGLGSLSQWNWGHISRHPSRFRKWLADNQSLLRSSGRFGNHRKYQSLDAHKPNGTGIAIETYIRWVDPPRTHAMLLHDAKKEVGCDPGPLFDYLYHSLSMVASFGRTAKFDFLTMAGKLGLAAIGPPSPYLHGSTGPLNGARLLFAGAESRRIRTADLDQCLVQLGRHLKLGMQVLEDALCNWQKSPNQFVPFRG